MVNSNNLLNGSRANQAGGKTSSEGSVDKAVLTSVDDPGLSIRFQFNPKELSFSVSVDNSEGKGARAEKSGIPKVSFSNIRASKVTMKEVYFDTYENHLDVVEEYISKLRQFARFVSPNQQRSHILMFSWGDKVYLKKCFLESFNYRLTMFLNDGTPVRAIIDEITLIETLDSNPSF